MTRDPVKIDAVSVASSTDHAIAHAQDTVENALRFLADPEAKERRANSKCGRCYYIWHSRIGGAAMTSQPCGICGKDVMYSSTVTDKICIECATANHLCVQCGADVLLRPRRIYERVRP